MRRFPLALAVAAMSLAVAAADDTFYLGTWKIVSAAVAPWASERDRPLTTTEMKALVGKTITIDARGIRGPRELACSPVKYEMKEYPADMLFQGAFGEMHDKDKSVDPAKVAAGVGFRNGTKWKTLETGCAVEIDYHFIDPATATFGLNDYVYTLKKQP
jgi:hypothetical protein